MSRALNDLCPSGVPRVMELLARLVELDVPVKVIDTLRTQAEHQLNLAKGTSWTSRSKHVPETNAACEACHGTKSHAIDLCPWDTYTAAPGGDKLLWQAEAPDGSLRPEWKAIGDTAYAVGLDWGGSWQTRKDWGHVDWPITTQHLDGGASHA